MYKPEIQSTAVSKYMQEDIKEMISQQSNLQFYHVRWSNKVIIIIIPLMNIGFP